MPDLGKTYVTDCKEDAAPHLSGRWEAMPSGGWTPKRERTPRPFVLVRCGRADRRGVWEAR